MHFSFILTSIFVLGELWGCAQEPSGSLLYSAANCNDSSGESGGTLATGEQIVSSLRHHSFHPKGVFHFASTFDDSEAEQKFFDHAGVLAYFYKALDLQTFIRARRHGSFDAARFENKKNEALSYALNDQKGNAVRALYNLRSSTDLKIFLTLLSNTIAATLALTRVEIDNGTSTADAFSMRTGSANEELIPTLITRELVNDISGQVMGHVQDNKVYMLPVHGGYLYAPPQENETPSNFSWARLTRIRNAILDRNAASDLISVVTTQPTRRTARVPFQAGREVVTDPYYWRESTLQLEPKPTGDDTYPVTLTLTGAGYTGTLDEFGRDWTSYTNRGTMGLESALRRNTVASRLVTRGLSPHIPLPIAVAALPLFEFRGQGHNTLGLDYQDDSYLHPLGVTISIRLQRGDTRVKGFATLPVLIREKTAHMLADDTSRLLGIKYAGHSLTLEEWAAYVFFELGRTATTMTEAGFVHGATTVGNVLLPGVTDFESSRLLGAPSWSYDREMAKVILELQNALHAMPNFSFASFSEPRAQDGGPIVKTLYDAFALGLEATQSPPGSDPTLALRTLRIAGY